jgi:hypothetical protein
MTDKLWLHSQQMQEIFFFSKIFELDLGPIQLPVQWVLGAASQIEK